ncbi:hypothetical protein QRX50_24370 [Amycolatopsis carbonis]|uniref:Uncharacterized protein n=1 Tax=Amycolatopsis carbonis TaxID=715471 RepID=A0A9Y2MW84_9PSEU|nr:hypothetical protein [Amycolatopsis sp. 2-15]WIX83665.1 hypothetical protein QRX50_24370 [Amycolatopsis sp. 2-15]
MRLSGIKTSTANRKGKFLDASGRHGRVTSIACPAEVRPAGIA